MASNKHYAEHDKLHAIKQYSQQIHDFLEFASEKGIELCSREEGENFVERYPLSRGARDRLMYEFFEIDPNRLEEEKREMLDELRKLNEETT